MKPEAKLFHGEEKQHKSDRHGSSLSSATSFLHDCSKVILPLCTLISPSVKGRRPTPPRELKSEPSPHQAAPQGPNLTTEPCRRATCTQTPFSSPPAPPKRSRPLTHLKRHTPTPYPNASSPQGAGGPPPPPPPALPLGTDASSFPLLSPHQVLSAQGCGQRAPSQEWFIKQLKRCLRQMRLSRLFINNSRSLQETEIKGTVEVTSRACLQSPRET